MSRAPPIWSYIFQSLSPRAVPMRLTLLLALAAGLTPRLSAQRDTATVVVRTTGSFFAVSVGSMQATQAWYEHTLGLRVALRPPPSSGVSAVILEGDGLMVELIESERSAPAQGNDPITRQGLFKVGVIVENYEAVLQRLREQGVAFAFGPFPAGNGQRANFAVRDPSGTLLQFFAR